MNKEKMIDDEVLDEALDKLASFGVIDNDLDLTLPSNPIRDRWNVWLDTLRWAPESGVAEGIWTNRGGSGHACLWTCRWATSTGEIGPNDLLPLDKASDEQLLAEMEDRLTQSKYGYLRGRSFSFEQECERLITQFRENKDENTRYWVKELLKGNRGYPIVYYCAWDPPRNVLYRYDRPSWPTEADFPKEEDPLPTEPEKPPEGKGETIYF
jgi:hypothetical protein